METTLTAHSPVIKNGIVRAIFFLLISLLFCGLVETILSLFTAKTYTENLDIGSLLVSFIITKIGLVLCTWLFMAYINKQPFKALGFAWKGYSNDAYTGFLVGIITLAIGTFILLFNKNISFTAGHFDGSDLLLSILLFMVVAFIEEIAIRGYFLNNLMQNMNKWLALAISAFVFTLLHLNNPDFGIIAFINVFIAGLFLGINYIYTKNLWFSIFLHFSWNFFQGPILGYKVSGIEFHSLFQQLQNGPNILTGGSFGFEGSVVSALLQLVAIACLAWYYSKRSKGFRL